MSSSLQTHVLFATDEQLKELQVPEHLVGVYQQVRYRLGFGIRSFVLNQALAKHTLATQVIPLSLKDVNQLLHLIKQEQDSKYGGDQQQQQQDKVVEIVPNLITQIEAATKCLYSGDSSTSSSDKNLIFVKLDSRSPKDAPFSDLSTANLDAIAHDMQQEIMQLKQTNLEWHWNSHVTLDLFMKSIYKRLIVENATTAIELLVKSRRVREDLEQVKQFYQHGLSTCLCVRKYNKELIEHPELEFRAFVHDNKLTAISQYDYLTSYPIIVKNKQAIEVKLKQFVETIVIPALSVSHQTYIVDLFLYPPAVSGNDDSFGDVLLIELNSFESWTGACLFSWGEDSQVLLNGPFEFRICEAQQKDEQKKSDSGEDDSNLVDMYIAPKMAQYLHAKLQHLETKELKKNTDKKDESTSSGYCNVS